MPRGRPDEVSSNRRRRGYEGGRKPGALQFQQVGRRHPPSLHSPHGMTASRNVLSGEISNQQGSRTSVTLTSAPTLHRESPRPRPRPNTADRCGPVGIGIIGAGYWGPKLVRNLSELPQSKVRMVADLMPERRDEMQRQFPSVHVTADHRELLSHREVDAVVVATPVRSHFALAREALMAGKHVLVEKPLAASGAEARELVQVAEERGLCLMVGQTFEFNPAVQKLRDLLQEGELGKIHYIDMARLSLGLFQEDVNVIW